MLRRENSNSQQLKDQLRKMDSKRNGLQQELDNLQEKHVELKMNVAELETQLESARSGVSAVTLEIRHMLNEVNSEKPFYSIVLAVYISGHGIVLIAWTRKRNCAPCVPCRFTAEQERERWKADKLYKHDLEHLQEREENLQQVLRREQNLQLEMEEQQLERNILLGNVKQVWRLMGFAWASSITTTALPDVSMSTTDPVLRNLSINCHTVAMWYKTIGKHFHKFPLHLLTILVCTEKHLFHQQHTSLYRQNYSPDSNWETGMVWRLQQCV